MAEGIPLVALEFPGELRFAGDVLTVGDVNVTAFLRDALGKYPRIHGRLFVRFVAEPLTNTVASSTMGGAYQEPAELADGARQVK
jgi:hypothetical protein